MQKSTWQVTLARFIGYAGVYWLILGVFYIVWILFFLTPTIPPLWQQIIGCLLMPFGLLVKIPADSLAGIIVCMALNTLLWSSLVLLVRERVLQKP